MNVVLIGFSGTGKSSVAQILAEMLGWRHVDTDREVERAAGMPIHRVFAQRGERGFRQLERAAVREALRGERRVIALGGGAVLDPDNRREMRDGNLVVLLDGPVETLHARLASHVGVEPRPLLEAEDALGRMAVLKAEREPMYRETAHMVVDTDGLDAYTVARRIAAALPEHVRPRTDAVGKGERERAREDG